MNCPQINTIIAGEFTAQKQEYKHSYGLNQHPSTTNRSLVCLGNCLDHFIDYLTNKPIQETVNANSITYRINTDYKQAPLENYDQTEIITTEELQKNTSRHTFTNEYTNAVNEMYK